MAHVRFLADDALEGRGVATRGEHCAGEYIASFFESLGLEPAGDAGTFFQAFQVRTGSRLAAPGSLGISPGEGGEGNPFSPADPAWRPYGFSGSGEVTGALFYAGSGAGDVGPAQEAASGDQGAGPLEGRVVVVEASVPEVPAGDPA